MNPANSDPHEELRAALQRDAARIQEGPFDASLHHETMRRIRALEGTGSTLAGWPMMALGAACLVMLVLGVLFAPWRRPSTDVADNSNQPTHSTAESTRTSAWSYQRAALQGDEALLAMLDRDARELLPATASPFSNPLN